MLKRCGIQGKLQITGGLLCLVVITLAVQSIRSIYAYRELASQVSDRAAELPLASGLTQGVDSLRNEFHHIKATNESHLAQISLTEERNNFRIELASVRASAHKYREQLDSVSEYQTFLSDRTKERETFDSMLERLDSIDKIVSAEKWALAEVDYIRLEIELDNLAKEAQELPTFLQDRMAGLRDDVRGYYRSALTWTGLTSLIAILLFGAVGLGFHFMVATPFQELLSGSRVIAAENFDHRIDLGTEDELNELAVSMNAMTDRFQRKEAELNQVIANQEKEIHERTREALRNEQLASVGFLAAGVAHEINNPLAAIAWSAESLESRLHSQLHALDASMPQSLDADQLKSLRENLKRVQDEAFRCKEITEQLLDFSRLGHVKRKAIDLKALIEDVASMVGTLGQYRCKTVNLDCPDSVAASINGQEIRQVVLNLLTNALESVESEGAVDVRLRQRGDVAVLTVEDNGRGMTDEVKQHLFEPFFTSGKEGQGTGLGLSISYRIVQQHCGRMTAHSEGPGRGARLEVTLPIENGPCKNEAKQAA